MDRSQSLLRLQFCTAKTLCAPIVGEHSGNTSMKAAPGPIANVILQARNTIGQSRSYDALKNVVHHQAVIPGEDAWKKMVVAEKNPNSCAQVELLSVAWPLPKPCALATPKPKRRRSVVSVEYTKQQKAVLQARAKAARLSVNAFIKVATLGTDTYRPPFDNEMRKTLLGLYRQVSGMATNINQITRRVNGNNITPTEGVSILEGIRIPLARTLDAVRKVLTHGLSGMAP